MAKKVCLKTLFRILVVVVVLLTSGLTVSAAVNVYAEGAYTDSDLVVYIYADITDDAVCSAGIKLTYDSSVVTFVSAEKNEAIWFMGDGTTNHSYMDPEDAGDGVIVICGKLDTGDPTAGVIGDRVLLGKVTFSIDASPIATPVSDPEKGFFGIGLDLGRGGAYVNFATTAGVDLDPGVTVSSIIIKERGDANADRVINVQDISAVSYVIANGGYTPPMPWKDCNGDETVNVQDISCVSYAIAH